MNNIVTIVMNTAIPAGMTWLFAHISKGAKKRDEEIKVSIDSVAKKVSALDKTLDKHMKETLRTDVALMWSQLESKCNNVLREGYCDVGTRVCIEQLYERYKAIGGNHGMNVKVKKALDLCNKDLKK